MKRISFRELGLSEEILKALEKLGYENPSEVQEKAIPFVFEGKDIVVKSKTGSGKTAAFGIPICEKAEIEERKPIALVLTPTRELALQVKEDISNIGRFKKIRSIAVFGKQPMEEQKIELKQRVHVVVGTPGRTMDHIERENVDFSKLKYLVIDEADKMLNMGFIDQVKDIIKKLPRDRITMLFSATMSEEIENICNKYMMSPINIEIKSEELAIEKIQQVYYEIEEEKKFSLLNKVIYIERPDSCIIFCATKEEVDNVFRKMKEKGYSALAIHGGMEQKDRLDTMAQFKRGATQFLIATDVAARGIHIEDITHVINYDISKEMESYVHRIGRTGRAGNKGKAITFVSQRELYSLGRIEEYIGYKIPKEELPTEEEVEQGKKIFKEKIKIKPKVKKDKSNELNKEIMKLHLNAGKKKKIRPGDVVGAIISIEGITADDIGIINVQDNFTYVDILDKKGKFVLEQLQNVTIKGKKVRVQRAEK